MKRKWKRGPDVPVQVVVRDINDRLADQDVDKVDFAAIAKAEFDPRQEEIPSLGIDELREMFSRSGLGKAGLTVKNEAFLSAKRNRFA